MLLLSFLGLKDFFKAVLWQS